MVRSSSSFSSEGGGWMRYRQGARWRPSSSAAATLAAIMNSSISRWLSRRGRGITSATRPFGCRITWRSGRSRSSVPRGGAGGEQGAEGGIERREQRLRLRVEADGAVVRLLHLFVGQARGAAHQAAAEAVAGLAAVGVDVQFGEQAAAVFLRAQAAPAVRQRLGQHRHDAIGEIDAVAALARRAIERGARPHVVGDVGDGDDQAVAAAGGRARRTRRRRNRARRRRRW